MPSPVMWYGADAKLMNSGTLVNSNDVPFALTTYVASGFVAKTGDTMTGTLSIVTPSNASPALVIDYPFDGYGIWIDKPTGAVQGIFSVYDTGTGDVIYSIQPTGIPQMGTNSAYGASNGFGFDANPIGQYSCVYGDYTVGGYYGVVIGYSANCFGYENNVVIGYTAQSNDEQNVAIGAGALADGIACLTIGAFSSASSLSTAVGYQVNLASITGCVAIGSGTTTRTAQSFSSGCDSYPITDVFFGCGDFAHFPVSTNISATSTNAVAATVAKKGGSLAIRGGLSNSTLSGGDVSISVAPANAGGTLTTNNTYSQVILVDATNTRVDVNFPLRTQHQVVRNRQTVANVNATCLPATNILAYTSISAARAVTLSANASYTVGATVVIKDESGSCSGANTITISPSAGTINGAASLVLNSAYAQTQIYYAGGTAWFTG